MIQVTIDCFWSIVYLTELGWSIYGNTFIYTSGSQYCRGKGDTDVDAFALWISALILIFWGYCLMLYLLGVICFAVGVCCVYRSWSFDTLSKMAGGGERDENGTPSRGGNLQNMPILSQMEAYRIRRYE